MLKHILIPLDGSHLAEEAIEHAQEIIEPKGKVTLVTAVDVPEAFLYGYHPAVVTHEFEAAANEILPAAKHYLESIASRLTAHGLTTRIVAEIGEAADLIVSTAEKYQVDAIVISTHGRSGLSRWLFGSVTGKVLSARPCPVYVVPSREKHKAA